jgi:Secretion system C-terminal sorting domain
MRSFFLIGAMMIQFIAVHAQYTVYATEAGGKLYLFDVQNCIRKFVGETGQGFGDIALTPNANLWGIVGGNLYQINTQTAQVTFIGQTGLQAVSLVGLNDSTLLAESELQLYKIDTRDASTYLVGTIGYNASGDLTWYDNDLYMTTPLVRIELDSNYSSILRVTAIDSALPTCEGAATARFDNDLNAIVGFNGPDLLKICRTDGTYTVLCPNLNTNGTPGAAALRLPNQSPIPDACSLSTAVSNHIQRTTEVAVFPNPTEVTFTIQTESSTGFQYTLFNAAGQIVVYGHAEGASHTIATHTLTPGIYTLKCTIRGQPVWEKIVVQQL